MKENPKSNPEIAATPIAGQPENASELINKYGTYEIQPTSDSDNEFPAISQGMPQNKSMRPVTEKPPRRKGNSHEWVTEDKGGKRA